MILFLDDAESIVGLQRPDAREVHLVVEELIRFSKICLGITSRISTAPPPPTRLQRIIVYGIGM